MVDGDMLIIGRKFNDLVKDVKKRGRKEDDLVNGLQNRSRIEDDFVKGGRKEDERRTIW